MIGDEIPASEFWARKAAWRSSHGDTAGAYRARLISEEAARLEGEFGAGWPFAPVAAVHARQRALRTEKPPRRAPLRTTRSMSGDVL